MTFRSLLFTVVVSTLGYAPLYAQQQEGGEVGNHECATAVLGGQAGEAQEITESDGTAGYRQHDTETGVPVFCFSCSAHVMIWERW